MQTKSEQVAAIVAELEEEIADLHKHIEYLRTVMNKGLVAVMAPGSNVLVPLPTPKEIAFGQRWAIVFTIGPNNIHEPSLDNLFCPLRQPNGESYAYLTNNDMSFGLEELPELGIYLGVDASATNKL